MSMDNREVTLLVLYLSAAFETTEHSIVLNILQQDFGVVGTALNWFGSFRSGRKQRTLVGDKTSDDFNLNCGAYGAYVIHFLRLPPLQQYFSASPFRPWLC